MATSLLQLDPQRRLGAEEAMLHLYFNNLPRKLLELPDGKLLNNNLLYAQFKFKFFFLDVSIFSVEGVHLYPEHYTGIK